MLIKRQIELDHKKPELKVFSFYSTVAKEFGLTIGDVDKIYSNYIDQVVEHLPKSTKLSLVNLGEFKVNPRKLRVTFFRRIIYMCDVLLDSEDTKKEEKVELSMDIIRTTLHKMMKNFESCTICNKKEHTSYMCVRNAVGNIYYNIDRISHLKDSLTQKVIQELKTLYEDYAPRIIKKAEELGSVEFGKQYKEFILKHRPELEETWGQPSFKKQKITKQFLSIDELEQIYIPQYDIRYYL